LEGVGFAAAVSADWSAALVLRGFLLLQKHSVALLQRSADRASTSWVTDEHSILEKGPEIWLLEVRLHLMA
jgi:hypothetical protein